MKVRCHICEDILDVTGSNVKCGCGEEFKVIKGKIYRRNVYGRWEEALHSLIIF